jgi:5'-3' exonuclease
MKRLQIDGPVSIWRQRLLAEVYLIDGTYELFRHFFAVPPASDSSGQEIGAVRGVVASVLSMIDKGARLVGVATDHVIESFRNDLYPGYKTGEGVPPQLMSQFPILEEALQELGVVVWPMIEFEADDALASAAVKATGDERVSRVIICTPDKDLAQSVSGTRIVQLDRRQNITRDETGVIQKFGVGPKSIPDYLAVVGDTADGYPGLPKWGAKAAASVLAVYPHFEDIPRNVSDWPVSIRNSRNLSAILNEHWNDALLYRTLATLRLDVPVFEDVFELEWKGPKSGFEAVCTRLRAPDYLRRANNVLMRT